MTDAPGYFFNRQGTRSGPHTLEEIAGFIAAGEITTTSWVFREGDTKWNAATSFPELANLFPETPAPAAADPASTPTAAAPGPVAPAAARPSSLTKLPYATGQKPTAPGPYVRFAHLPAQAAALLTAAIPAPPPPHKRHPLRTLMLIALFALSAAAILADRAVGFERWVFTQVLVPTAAAGFLLVMLATHSRPGAALAGMLEIRPNAIAAFLGIALLVTGVGAVVLLANTESPEAAIGWLWLFPIPILFVALALGLRDRPSAGLTPRELAQVDMMTLCRDVIAALADDIATGKTATGWADLTGPRQPVKLMARGTSASGARVELFRDEWFHVTAPLRDGTRLRLAAVDREKVKHPRSRTRGRKTRTKPGSAQTLSTLEIRVRINPQVYRPLAPAAQTGQVGGLALSSIGATPDGVSAVFIPPSGLHLAAVMHALAHVYRHLERLPPAGAGGT